MAVPNSTPRRGSAGKVLLEVVISLILHPIAMILAWINIAMRKDLSTVQKVVWGIVCFFWGIGPILYIVLADGALW